ncbi:hypothetical protein [Hydrogenovibrio sp. JE_KL2]|uniref:hypothetical protein n=1 Tax=Hydrogenovibrio sp. JE_KL2 TaxID=2651188 RepID=UPI00128D134C|nr:hypothetical protein [Hydrogenovibrio sp. JE_KL2]MPQ76801.1 hypothetical protein [Hydrogenovibrio sp. JE_KL2]
MNISSTVSQMMSATVSQATQNGQQNQQTLTDDQKQQVKDTLSNYDSSNITQSDFESIFQQFQQAGIPMGDSLKSTVESEGFDFSSNIQAEMQANGMQPPGGRMPPPPPQQSSSSDSDSDDSYSQQLSDLLTSYENGTATQSDFEAFINSIKANSSSTTGNIFSTTA